MKTLLRSSFMSCILPSPCNPPNLEEYIQHQSCHYAKTKTVFTFSLFHQHPHFYSMRFDKISVFFCTGHQDKNQPNYLGKSENFPCSVARKFYHVPSLQISALLGAEKWTGSDGDPQEGVGSFRVLHVCK